MKKPKLLVYASGKPDGGGSGFENLVSRAKERILDADVVGVVSNHEHGGVREKADRLHVPFSYFPEPWDASGYLRRARESGAEFFALSGWLKMVFGLDPRTTFNIHPALLPNFGGKGMHGHHVHEAVMAAYHRGEISYSAVCMHFLTWEPVYDLGPIFFCQHVRIEGTDTDESLGDRVNACEHLWQPAITNLVVHREITWDGHDPASLQVPSGYEIVREAA